MGLSKSWFIIYLHGLAFSCVCEKQKEKYCDSAAAKGQEIGSDSIDRFELFWVSSQYEESSSVYE